MGLQRPGARLRAGAVQHADHWRRAAGNVEVFDLSLCCLVSDALVVDDQVVRDAELVVRIAAQKCTVHLALFYPKLVAHLVTSYQKKVLNATTVDVQVLPRIRHQCR